MEDMDFGFYCMIDVLEEDVLNQKYCTEVLKKLISKNDTDIEELDTDIEELEGELLVLEWADQDKDADIFELCAKALGEKIKALGHSIYNLKNKTNHNDENGIAIQSQSDTEPVTKIHDIIGALRKKRHQEKDEQDGQLTDLNVIEDRSDDQMLWNTHLLDSSPEPEKLNIQESGACNDVTDTDSLKLSLMSQGKKRINVTESDQVEVQEYVVAVTGKVVDSNTSMKLQSQRAKDTIHTDKIKLHEVVANISSSVIQKAPSTRHGEKKKNRVQPGQGDVQELLTTASYKKVDLKSPLKLHRQKKNDKIRPEEVKVQEVGDCVNHKTNTLPPESSSTWQGVKVKNEPLCVKAEYEELQTGATGNLIELKSPLNLQTQKVRDKSNQTKSQAQESGSGVANATKSVGMKSASILQRQKKKTQSEHIDVQETDSSATGRVANLKSPWIMQRRRKKDMIQLDVIKVEEKGLAHTNNGSSNPNLMLPVKKERDLTKWQIETQKLRTSDTDRASSSKAQGKLKKQRAKDMSQSNKIRSLEPPVADNSGLSIILYSSKSEEEAPEMGKGITSPSSPVLVDLAPARKDSVGSNTRKRKLSSTSNNKGTKRIVMSSSAVVKKPNEGSTCEQLETIVPSGRVDMSIVPLPSDALVLKESAVTTAHSIPKYGPDPSMFSNNGDHHNQMVQAVISPIDLPRCTVPELKIIAKSQGLKGFSKFKKERLLELLVGVGRSSNAPSIMQA